MAATSVGFRAHVGAAAFRCSFCGRPNSDGAQRAAGACTTCPDGDGTALCDACVANHASKTVFRGHACAPTVEFSEAEALLLRLGLAPAPRVCAAHGGLPFVGLACVECTTSTAASSSAPPSPAAASATSTTTAAAAATAAKNGVGLDLCTVCVKLHSEAHPLHKLAPLVHEPDVRALRARLGAVAVALVDGCAAAVHAARGVLSAVPPLSGTFADQTRAKVQTQEQEAPLVACARHKAVSVAEELAALDEVEERALAQAAGNRDAAHAAVLARFEALAAQIRKAMAAKRATLTEELAVSDTALDSAIAATRAVVQVGRVGVDGCMGEGAAGREGYMGGGCRKSSMC